MSALKLFLIAGEPSGDRLGAALMAGLRSLAPVEFAGVGGPLMHSEGLASLFPMEELSVMGLMEILPKYFDLKARIAETAAAVIAATVNAAFPAATDTPAGRTFTARDSARKATPHRTVPAPNAAATAVDIPVAEETGPTAASTATRLRWKTRLPSSRR